MDSKSKEYDYQKMNVEKMLAFRGLKGILQTDG